MLDSTWDVHAADLPIPFPLTPEEIEALRAERLAALPPPTDPAAPPVDPLAGVDLDALARERGAARGKHYVEALYVCVECHGRDFGGGKMIDDPMVGTALGPNLTTGGGSVTKDYTPADWDRKVRHGVRPDRRSGLMPSEDYQAMSDRELADIVTYIRSLPPVDKDVPETTLGPLGKVLVATGQIPLGVQRVDQTDRHPVVPPPEGPTAVYGEHLSKVCTGCHRKNFEGGPMAGAPPDWLPPTNISPHEQGLKGWTYADFEKTMRSGVRPDGRPVGMPMVLMLPYLANWNDTELKAVWAYLETVPPVPDGV